MAERPEWERALAAIERTAAAEAARDPDHPTFTAHVPALVAEVRRLHSALDRYGWHDFECPGFGSRLVPAAEQACTCGFRAALEAADGSA